MKAKIILFSVFSVSLSACNTQKRTEVEKSPSIQTTKTVETLSLDSEELLSELLNSPFPSPRHLSQLIVDESKLKPVSAEARTELSNAGIYLYMGTSLHREEPTFIKNTLFDKQYRAQESVGFSELQEIALRQSKYLEQIKQAYAVALSKTTKEWGRDFVVYAKNHQPDTFKKIEESKLLTKKEALKEIVDVLKGYDKEIIQISAIPEEQDRLAFYFLLADSVWSEVKDTELGTKLKDAQASIKNLHQKTKEVETLFASIKADEKQIQEATKSLVLAAQGIRTTGQDLKRFFDNVDLKLEDKTKSALAQWTLSALTGERAMGAIVADDKIGSGPFQKARDLNANFILLTESSIKIFDRTSNIIKTTQNIASTLGVQLHPSVDKAINDIQRIHNSTLQAQNVLKGFQSGGIVGALSALSGNSGAASLASLAAGGPAAVMQMQMAAEMAQMNKKLDHLVQLSEMQIQLQKSTIAMIQDLALMVDDYHRAEMKALSDISKSIDDVKDAVAAGNNEGLLICNSLISASSVAKEFYSYDTRESVRQNRLRLKQKYRDFESLLKAMKASDAHRIANCQKAFDLLSSDISESYNHFYASNYSDKNKISDFERLVYNKATKFADEVASIQENELLLPQLKLNVGASQSFSVETSTLSPERLGKLLSASTVVAYSKSLLSLYPYVSASVAGVTEPIYLLQNSSSDVASHRVWLSSALSLLRRAIAQQAILVGAPMLNELSRADQSLYSKTHDCRTSSEFCWVRLNKVMMFNLVNLKLQKAVTSNPVDWFDYMISKNDLDGFAGALQIPVSSLKIQKGRLYFFVETKDEGSVFTTNFEINPKNDVITYHPEMKELVETAQLVANELALNTSGTIQPEVIREFSTSLD